MNIDPRMDSLRNYLNSLAPDSQADYARRCGTSVGYLRKAISVRPRMDGALVRALWQASNGRVTREELRPDIFGPTDDAA